MTDLLDRLRKRVHPSTALFTAAVGVNGCAAGPAVMQATSGPFTIGGPDRDMQDAVARIEALEAVVAPARELLTLYDWRPEIAKLEAELMNDGTDAQDQVRKVRKMLREYGERKKAGWIALRAALLAIGKKS